MILLQQLHASAPNARARIPARSLERGKTLWQLGRPKNGTQPHTQSRSNPEWNHRWFYTPQNGRRHAWGQRDQEGNSQQYHKYNTRCCSPVKVVGCIAWRNFPPHQMQPVWMLSIESIVIWKNPKAKFYPLIPSSRKLSGSPSQHSPEVFFVTSDMFSSISSEDLELQYPCKHQDQQHPHEQRSRQQREIKCHK